MTIYRKVRKVIDGDTLQTYRKVHGSNFVRIANLNAPELQQFGGRAALDWLKGQIQNKVVTLQPVAKDVYGRTVAKVRYNGRLIR